MEALSFVVPRLRRLAQGRQVLTVKRFSVACQLQVLPKHMHWNKRLCLQPALAARKELHARSHAYRNTVFHSHCSPCTTHCFAGPHSVWLRAGGSLVLSNAGYFFFGDDSPTLRT